MMPHKPNPFDFVPFTPEPKLYLPHELDALGPLMTGYLEVTLKALVPVHVVGAVRRGEADGQSYFYRQDGQPCIPASSIRGCLRSFVEALTAGWVSQANDQYRKERDRRHIGFRSFDSQRNTSQSGLVYDAPPAINPAFKPSARPDGRVDMASFLFGVVVERADGDEARHADLARKGKVLIEDAFLDESSLTSRGWWAPDLGPADATAFLGGGKPSASSWWYMQPALLRGRLVRGHLEVAEFVGQEFRGRKFYFHQSPRRCLPEYAPERRHYEPDSPPYCVHLECLPTGQSSHSFRIYVQRLPQPLLMLLVAALCPVSNIRHKLGYAKAFGYGSVQFDLIGAMLRQEEPGARLPGPLLNMDDDASQWTRHGWSRDWFDGLHLATMIDWNALGWLARILGARDARRVVCAYPEYTAGYFKTPVSLGQLGQRTRYVVQPGRSVAVTLAQGLAIARGLGPVKATVDFRHYQETAEGWDIIRARTP